MLAVFFLAGCNAEKKKMLQKIEDIEKSGKANYEVAVQKAELYEAYAEKFQKDEKAPLYLFKAAETNQAIGHYAKSVELFDLVAKRYPKYEKAGDALFYKGFVYENMLMDIPRAKDAYEEFLQKYPNHPLAADTRKNLPHLGGLPEWAEEMIENDSNKDSASAVY